MSWGTESHIHMGFRTPAHDAQFFGQRRVAKDIQLGCKLTLGDVVTTGVLGAMGRQSAVFHGALMMAVLHNEAMSPMLILGMSTEV